VERRDALGCFFGKELLIESKAVHSALEQSDVLQPVTERMEMVSLIQSTWVDNERCAVYLETVLRHADMNFSDDKAF